MSWSRLCYRFRRCAAAEILLTNLVDAQCFSSFTLCSARSKKRRALPPGEAPTREVSLQTPRAAHEGPRSCEELVPGTAARAGSLCARMPTGKKQLVAPLRDTTEKGELSIPSAPGISVGFVGKLFKATTKADTLSLRSQVGKGQERSETPSVSEAHPHRRRPLAAGPVPLAGGEVRPGRDGGGAFAGSLGPFSGPCPPAGWDHGLSGRTPRG